MTEDPHAPTPIPAYPTKPHTLRRLRAQVFSILHAPDSRHVTARWVNYFLAALIIANAISVTLETIPGINAQLATTLWWFEAVSTGVFIVESDDRPSADKDDERRRYFALTAHGKRVLDAEVRRLEAIVSHARSSRALRKAVRA